MPKVGHYMGDPLLLVELGATNGFLTFRRRWAIISAEARGVSPARISFGKEWFHMKKNIQDGSRYFRQRDIVRPVSGGLLVAALIMVYFGGWISYILACIMAPVALILFFVSGSRLISDKDMAEQLDHACLDYDRSVTDMQSYERVVLRQPAPVETSAYSFGADAAFFKRSKSGTLLSDRYARAHFFFTAGELWVVGRRISIAELGTEGGGVTEFSEAYLYSGIVANLEEHVTQVQKTTGGKPVTAKWYELVISAKEGEELLRLPVQNDMDVSGLCDEINRKAGQ